MASLAQYNGVLDRRKAAHLLRRATFGPTKEEIDQFTGLSVAQAVNTLYEEQLAPEAPIDPNTGQTWVEAPIPEERPEGHMSMVLGWWMDQMKNSGANIRERMVYFYHTHFTTKNDKVTDSVAIYYQNALFRQFAVGNFKEICRRICLDNAMTIFLDGKSNIKGRPNENFGREFLELYTIGKGPQVGEDDYTTYTELDVQEAARVLSGYQEDRTYANIDLETELPTINFRGNGIIAGQHDATPKTFSERFNNAVIAPPVEEMQGDNTTIEGALDELDQLVEMIFAQDETARYICRRLYRFFVYYEITEEVEQDVIEPLAQTFRDNNYELQPVLTQLLSSEHFFDTDNATEVDDNHGAIIKSPLELVIGSMRYFRVELPDPASELPAFYDAYRSILRSLNDQGLDLYNPFEVAGYPAYHQAPSFNRNWISANFLALRYLFIDNLMSNPEDGFVLDIIDFVRDPANNFQPAEATNLVQALVEYLFPEIITQERFDYFIDTFLDVPNSPELSPAEIQALRDQEVINWGLDWNTFINTNDDTGIRTSLENLVNVLLQTPEYQLF
ncbi:MAG: DUF1800 domain-containing protein [Bacteroidota bacterium]